jgi:hypothetical protein
MIPAVRATSGVGAGASSPSLDGGLEELRDEAATCPLQLSAVLSCGNAAERQPSEA